MTDPPREQPSIPTDTEIADTLMALAHERGAARSFCPSEAARRLSDDWRPLMPHIRRVAASLPLRTTQRGRAVEPLSVKGPIRLSLGRDDAG